MEEAGERVFAMQQLRCLRIMAFRNPAQLLVTVLHSIVFGFCDLADTLLCPVFRFLDWQLDRNSSPCFCAAHPNQAGSYNALEFWTGPSHTLYGRVKKWGGRKSKLSEGKTEDGAAVKNSRIGSFVKSSNGLNKPESSRARATCWSDCGCATCTAWLTKEHLLYVHADYRGGLEEILTLCEDATLKFSD